ncbi:MAG: DUF4956 domain-containing protein [Oscillospiraceae bacterium]|nr:DUF4956 domain-containing protein [Oscillospiraceae bacterium]
MFNSIFAGGATVISILIMLAAAAALGILNSLVFSFRTIQSKSFAVMLALLPIVSAVIIFTVNDNLGVGVAVAGAFTLVRFRSVAGNGREMLAIFASMAIGMLLGMGYIAFAVLVFASVAVLFLIVTITGLGERHEVRTLKIRIPEDLNYDGLFDDVFDRYTTMHQLEKVRTVNMGTMYELTYSVSFRDLSKSKQMIDEIRVRNGNLNVSIGSYGEHESI